MNKELEMDKYKHELQVEAWGHMVVECLPISTRAKNCLRNGNIITIGELVDRSPLELSKTFGLGKVCLSQIMLALCWLGLALREDKTEPQWISRLRKECRNDL